MQGTPNCVACAAGATAAPAAAELLVVLGVVVVVVWVVVVMLKLLTDAAAWEWCCAARASTAGMADDPCIFTCATLVPCLANRFCADKCNQKACLTIPDPLQAAG
jgi:hypothetical protein